MWNAGGEASNGVREWNQYQDVPQPPLGDDAAWYNGEPAFELESMSQSTPPTAGRERWSNTNFFGATHINNQILTDAQGTFDANESDRTTRGVPVMVLLRGTSTLTAVQYIMTEHPAGFARPSLIVDWEGPKIPFASESASETDSDAVIAVEAVNLGVFAEIQQTSTVVPVTREATTAAIAQTTTTAIITVPTPTAIISREDATVIVTRELDPAVITADEG